MTKKEHSTDEMPIADALEIVIPALESFLCFDKGDLAFTDRQRWQRELQESLPIHGIGALATLELLAQFVIPHGTPLGAPGFCGWITTMPTLTSSVAAFTASLAGAQRWWVQSYNYLEHLSLEWLKQLLQLPAEYQGIYSSGGSTANLIALGGARQRAYEKIGSDPAARGVGGSPAPRIYASRHAHHIIGRSAAVLGLGRESVVEIATDSSFRLSAEALSEQLSNDRRAGCLPIAVVATAGTTNTGAIDPLDKIALICRQHDVWMHVDGAYGAFGILDGTLRSLYDGLSSADSIVVDPHKWLGVPVGCGATFVRDASLQRRAFTLMPAEYLEGSTMSGATSQFDDFGYTFHHLGLEQSAQSRGVTVWAALKELGSRGLSERISMHNRFARRVEERVKASSVLELLAPVTLSICCFRYIPSELPSDLDSRPALNELNRRIVRALHRGHHHIPTTTELDGVLAIRPCYINPRTTQANVDDLVNQVEAVGHEQWQEYLAEHRSPQTPNQQPRNPV